MELRTPGRVDDSVRTAPAPAAAGCGAEVGSGSRGTAGPQCAARRLACLALERTGGDHLVQIDLLDRSEHLGQIDHHVQNCLLARIDRLG